MQRDLKDVKVSLYRDVDDESLLSVFRRVFQSDRTLEEFRWLYRGNPEGLQYSISRFDDGQVVSGFSAIPRRVQLPDGPALFGEVVDSYTDPDFRQGLRRKGSFATAGEWFAQAYGRYDRDVVMYGLPTPQNFRIGQRFLGYSLLKDVTLLARDLSQIIPEPVSNDCVVVPVERFGASVDSLWGRVAEDLGAAVVRDRTYLNWRYADHPQRPYELFEYHDHRRVAFAIAVLKKGFLAADHGAVADFLVEPGHWAAADVVRHLEARARVMGIRVLRCMLLENRPEWKGLTLRGWEPELSDFKFTARTFSPERVTLPWLRDHWYTTLGDFDVV